MNHIIKRQSIFTPHKWLSPQIEYFFEKLSTMPLAKTLLEMDDQVQICFKQSIEWVEEKYCHEKTLLLCPEALAGYHIPNQNIMITGTTKEFFFFGPNGSLEIRKQGPVHHREIKDLLAMNYNFKQLYLCYSKLGAD